MHAPSDELQDLLARLMSRAHEAETRVIYRGEPKCFRRISSGLYRQLHEIATSPSTSAPPSNAGSNSRGGTHRISATTMF